MQQYVFFRAFAKSLDDYFSQKIYFDPYMTCSSITTNGKGHMPIELMIKYKQTLEVCGSLGLSNCHLNLSFTQIVT